MKDLVQRLLSRMGRSKTTPICPYVFHLCQAHELLLLAEKKEYRIKEAPLKHNVESKGEEDPESPEDLEEEESSDDSKCESLTSGPTPKPISVATPRPLVHPSFLSQLEKIT